MKQVQRPVPDRLFEKASEDRCKEHISSSKQVLGDLFRRIAEDRKKILPFMCLLSGKERKELYRKVEEYGNVIDSYYLEDYVSCLILKKRVVGEFHVSDICPTLIDIKNKRWNSSEIFLERQKIDEARKGKLPIIICTTYGLLQSLEPAERRWFIGATGKVVRNEPDYDRGSLEDAINRLPQMKYLVENFTAGDAVAWLIETYKEGKLEELLG